MKLSQRILEPRPGLIIEQETQQPEWRQAGCCNPMAGRDLGKNLDFVILNKVFVSIKMCGFLWLKQEGFPPSVYYNLGTALSPLWIVLHRQMRHWSKFQVTQGVIEYRTRKLGLVNIDMGFLHIPLIKGMNTIPSNVKRSFYKGHGNPPGSNL